MRPGSPRAATQYDLTLGAPTKRDGPVHRPCTESRRHRHSPQGPAIGWLGTFPIRFPSDADPGDDGWHIDTSFPPPQGEVSDFFQWRANVRSKGRALLMLFLFSDVAEDEAPTRVRLGSHKTMARRLAPHGDEGLSLGQLAAEGFDDSADCPVALATGEAGDVWLCHPFLVHAAQGHLGKRVKFMAQPPLMPKRRFDLEMDQSPMLEAIRRGLR